MKQFAVVVAAFIAMVGILPSHALAQSSTGFYLGGFAQTTRGNYASKATLPQRPTVPLSGALVGYRMAASNVVLGLEGDLAAGTTELSFPTITQLGGCVNCYVEGSLLRISGFGHIRGTIVRNVLPNTRAFLGIGAAFGTISRGIYAEVSAVPTDYAEAIQNNFQWGLSIGAGVEREIRPGLSLRGEVLLDRFFARPHSVSGTVSVLGTPIPFSDTGNFGSISLATARVTLIWNF